MIIPWLTRALLSTVLHSVCGMEFTKLTMNAVVNTLKGKNLGSSAHLRSWELGAKASGLRLGVGIRAARTDPIFSSRIEMSPIYSSPTYPERVIPIP